MRRYVCFAAVAFLLGTPVFAHAQKIPGHVQNRFKLMVGDWESETTWNGTVTRTTWTTRPSGGNAGLANNLKMEDPAGSSFRGYEAVSWDATLKAVVCHGVTSRGGFWRVAYDHLTENQWKGHLGWNWDDGRRQ